MNQAAGLAVALARLGPAEQLAVQIQLVELAVPVAAEEVLCRGPGVMHTLHGAPTLLMILCGFRSESNT